MNTKSFTVLTQTVLTLSLLTCSINGANILFFFLGGNYSHKLSVWPFVCALANNGHNVTFFSKYKKQPESHIHCDKVTDLTSPSIDAYNEKQGSFAPLEIRQAGESDRIWQSAFQGSLDICEIVITNAKTKKDPVLQYLVYEGDFDLIINNAIMSDCGYILANHYQSKLIISSSTVFLPWFQELYGLPTEASWVPDWSVMISYPMSLFDRIRSFYLPIYYHFYRHFSVYPKLEQLAMHAYDLNISTVPSILEMEKSASIVLIQTHATTGMSRSLPPNFIEVGGMQCWQPKQKQILEGSALQKTLDSAHDGAILIAFGSSVDFSSKSESAVTSRFQSLLLKTVATFPKFKFILAGDIEEEDGKPLPKNLFVGKWLPQSEILGHPNVKAFITHGGLNSVTEATYYGVPLIVLPLFVDQDYNGYRIQSERIGITLEFKDVKLDHLVKAVREILSNSEYAKNMKNWSKVFKDRPMNPIETAVYWAEFVLRNEDFSMLRPDNIQLNWFQRHLLDVYFVLFAMLLVVLTAVAVLVFKSVRYITSHTSYPAKKTKLIKQS